MKVLFLDIDGVLNNCEFDPRTESTTIDGHPTSFLNSILDETDCKVVISSAWRYLVHEGAVTLGGFEALLRSHGVRAKGRLIGITSKDKLNGVVKHVRNSSETARAEGQRASHAQRVGQIREWLEFHRGDGIEVFGVLDDLALPFAEGFPADFRPAGFFVQTDGTRGLTYEDAVNVIGLFGGPRVHR